MNYECPFCSNLLNNYYDSRPTYARYDCQQCSTIYYFDNEIKSGICFTTQLLNSNYVIYLNYVQNITSIYQLEEDPLIGKGNYVEIRQFDYTSFNLTPQNVQSKLETILTLS